MFIRFMINPYELIHPQTSYRKFLKEMEQDYKYYDNGYTKGNEISRALYKALEFVKLCKLDKLSEPPNILTLADAPGGFTQILSILYPTAKIITSSYKVDNPDKNVIIYDEDLSKLKNVKIDYLLSGNGDLTDSNNIKYMLEQYGSTFDIITADGAFDFDQYPGVPNETVHTQLFLAEVISMVLLQKPGGSGCIKMYTCYSDVTNKIVFWLTSLYEAVSIFKMKSMRIYNNETMLVCQGFKGFKGKKEKDILLSAMDKIKPQETYKKFIHNFFEISTNVRYEKQISQFNKRLEKIRVFCGQYGMEVLGSQYKKMVPDFYQDQVEKLKKFI